MQVRDEMMELDEKEVYDKEAYVSYAVAVEHTIRQVQQMGVEVTTPTDAAMVVLKAATEFYDADWCGVINIDMIMKLWTPIWWYNAVNGEMAALNFPEWETHDCEDHWIEHIQNRTITVLPDTSALRKEYPAEYEVLKNANVHSLIAVPFWQNPTGFLILKNPRNYCTYTSMLQLLNYTVITSLHEFKMMETLRLRSVSPRVSDDKDVFVNLFGELKITTSKGVITETELKSPKIVRLFAYLLLTNRTSLSAAEIQDALWPNEECDAPGRKIKNLVYRLQQAFNLISDYRLIEFTGSGYRINRNLNITTDVHLFVTKCQQALSTVSEEKKKDLLQRALALYKGDLLSSESSELWLMPKAQNYRHYFLGMFSELMQLYDKERYYEGIRSYASNALVLMPNTPEVFFWLIRSDVMRNHFGLAKSELSMAKNALLEEDYLDLKERLCQSHPNFNNDFFIMLTMECERSDIIWDHNFSQEE